MEVKLKYKDTDLTQEDKKLYQDFVKFLISKYPLNQSIEILFLGEKTDHMSTGSQNEGVIKILAKNRLNRDIMRTVAHEWVHAYQRLVLNRERGPDIGGQNEDEANAFAGQLIKMFEKDYPGYNELVFENLKPIVNKLDLLKEEILKTEKQNLHNEFINEMKKIGIEKLPYSYSSMKQFVDPKTMDIHYNKHYKGYVKKLNDALSKKNYKDADLEDIIKSISKYDVKVRNNAGGAFNHALFWKMLSPKKQLPKGEVFEKIKKQYGNLKKLKDEFNQVAKDRFGSGWAWLILTKSNRLKIMSTPNQDNPLMNIVKDGGYPLLGLDLWEHAYYLKYQNKRDEYINNFWNHINWEFVNELFNSKTKKKLNENNNLGMLGNEEFRNPNSEIPKILIRLCRSQKKDGPFCRLAHLSKLLDNDTKVDLEVSLQVLNNYFRFKNIGLFPAVVDLALQDEGRTVNYLKLLADFIEDDKFDDTNTKKILNRQRNSEHIPNNLEELLKQARTLEHQKYEERFLGDFFDKKATFLKLDYKCGDDATDTLFTLLNKIKSKEKTIDLVFEQMVKCIKESFNSGIYYLKADVVSKKDLKYNDEVIFKSGTYFEVKKMDPFIDSYLSEFFSIFKESSLSKLKGKYLDVYNELIQKLYDWLISSNEATMYLEKVKSQMGGIIYDYDTIVPIEYIDLYWSNKGQRGCDEKRLSIRFKIKNKIDKIKTFRFKNSEELIPIIKDVPNTEKEKVICK